MRMAWRATPEREVSKVKGLRPRRIPQRTCVACQQEQAKRELVRVVRTPEGQVEVDPTGRKSGRGAYLHKSRECWELGLKRDALERALKTKLNEESRAALQGYAATLG